MRYAHTNLIVKDWQAVSRFYQRAFGCVPVPPERDLSGEWLDRLTEIVGAQIRGEHLRLPGYGDQAPTLEIFSYEDMEDRLKPLNGLGYAHIAFEVDDVRETVRRIQEEGGSLVREIVKKEYQGIGMSTFAYTTDIEGNIVEIQSWER